MLWLTLVHNESIFTYTKKFELIIRIFKYTLFCLNVTKQTKKETNVLKKEAKIVKMKSTLRLHVYVVWVTHSGLKFSFYHSLF